MPNNTFIYLAAPPLRCKMVYFDYKSRAESLDTQTAA